MPNKFKKRVQETGEEKATTQLPVCNFGGTVVSWLLFVPCSSMLASFLSTYACACSCVVPLFVFVPIFDICPQSVAQQPPTTYNKEQQHHESKTNKGWHV